MKKKEQGAERDKGGGKTEKEVENLEEKKIPE